MNAESLEFADASFDVVFSSMFLHEVPRAGIARVLREAHRVLRPGGLMLHMELPPNGSLAPFDAFYLDWDSAYNNEPFYKPFRDLDPRSIVSEAGFRARDFVEFALPSMGSHESDATGGARCRRVSRSIRGAPVGSRMASAGIASARGNSAMHDSERLVGWLYAALGRCDGEAMADCYTRGASFSDPVFPALAGAEVGDMWRMLCHRAGAMRVEVTNIVADDATGSADWQAPGITSSPTRDGRCTT